MYLYLYKRFIRTEVFVETKEMLLIVNKLLNLSDRPLRVFVETDYLLLFVVNTFPYRVFVVTNLFDRNLRVFVETDYNCSLKK